MLMEADRVTIDDTKKISTFEGNVQMRQGTLFIEASKIVVIQDKKGNNQLTASGQLVQFRQKREGVNEYIEGFGERIEYDSLAEIANIFGQARIKREGDDVQGEHIIYNTKTGVFKVFGANNQNPEIPGISKKGRVTVIIQPKAAVNAPASGVLTSGALAPAAAPSTTHPQTKQ